jgi:hypothetical protein
VVVISGWAGGFMGMVCVSERFLPPAGWAENGVSGRMVLDRRCEAIELTVGGVVFAKVQSGRGSYGRVVGGKGLWRDNGLWR